MTTNFIDDSDTMLISSDYPYTYTDLRKMMANWCKQSNKDKVRASVLCKTLAGNELPMLVITNFASRDEEIGVRPGIILTARVHPGYMTSFYLRIEKLMEAIS